MQNKTAGIVAAFLLLIPFLSSGQKSINSPIARYNLGIIETPGPFRSLGMAGTGTAMRDRTSVYYTNPASYSSLDTNSFIFDFGLDYGINMVSDGNTNDVSDDLNFDHIILGFPVTRRWGVALGLVPFSNGYYNLSETVREGDSGYDEITGEYISYHRGSGGYTSFFIGTGLNLTKNLSVGANMSLLFGSIRRVNEFDFADYYYTFQTSMNERLQMTGIGFDLGAQYSVAFKEAYFLNLGASYSTGRKCKTTLEKTIYRFNVYSSNDILDYSYDDDLKSSLPGSVSTGLAIGKKNKFVAAADYTYAAWGNAEFPGSEGYVANTGTFSLGAEYTPDWLANYNFLKRIDYRIGVHTGKNYLLYNGSRVKETGVSIGLGVPMRRSYSKTNFFADYTRKNIADQPFTHTENYFSFGISINMYDFWFIKRRYE
ncbi:MAG: hypothetical protein MUE74_12850 [Bacteroidales bacterium]|jgi:hypothetical protein|nr:hypothetical protein [Bacteroidales bacterium]